MARLTGKVALITGAAGGQGMAEAELFAREEASVVMTDIDGGVSEALAERVKLLAVRFCSCVRTLPTKHHGQRRYPLLRRIFGKLHVLVNNAGVIDRQGIVNATVEAWNRTLAVNLTGAMLGMKHCAPPSATAEAAPSSISLDCRAYCPW